MEDADIAPDVLRFILERIDSVPHLEALLLLWGSGGQRWTEAEIGSRVYVGGDTARGVLETLTHRGLVVAEATTPMLYAYDGRWDKSGRLMADVAATYRRQLVKVAQIIHAKASPSVQEFARAFHIKKDQ